MLSWASRCDADPAEATVSAARQENGHRGRPAGRALVASASEPVPVHASTPCRTGQARHRAQIDTMNHATPMTRTAALDQLATVIPHVGRAYATGRNTDAGPGRRPTTTILSPYLRRRLITEEEVVSAALDEHGLDGAGKFVEEIFWRTYFKGHLETRPDLWSRYIAQVASGRDQMAAQSGLRRAYESAVAGNTGIDGFDDWARELTKNGWLHNHSRMWFASIWIFTLRLPWALGADFFLRHLVDGDPASNTLSWRWVAGLHTRGKTYAARADNIQRYTDGRFSPKGLNEYPEAIVEDDPPGPTALAEARSPPERRCRALDASRRPASGELAAWVGSRRADRRPPRARSGRGRRRAPRRRTSHGGRPEARGGAFWMRQRTG